MKPHIWIKNGIWHCALPYVEVYKGRTIQQAFSRWLFEQNN